MSRTIEPYLPIFGQEKPSKKSRTGKGDRMWYYIYKPRADEMLVIDDDGCWCWVGHDTVRDTPYLFNNRNTAKRQAQRFGLCTIRRYNWEVRE